VHNIPIEELDVTLDKLCESHLVLRRWVRTYQSKTHVVKYYCCHRGGRKKTSTKPKVKSCTSSITQERREMMFRLCNCSFQIRTMEPLNKENQIEDSSVGMTTISLHTKHSGHQPGTDIDKLFLPVHRIVVTLAMENLKRMVSTSTVALAFKNEEKKL
jgi:hypothetical protein